MWRRRTKSYRERSDVSRQCLIACVLVACGSSSHPVAPPSASVDLVVYDAKITTLDDARPEVSALAVAKGQIIAIGDDATIRALASDRTQSIDGHGRRIIPGLIDDHAHYIRGGLTWNIEV